jgi:hypothetical protein
MESKGNYKGIYFVIWIFAGLRKMENLCSQLWPGKKETSNCQADLSPW